MRKAVFVLLFLAVPVFGRDHLCNQSPPRDGHGREMTEQEIEEMRQWVKDGKPEGVNVWPTDRARVGRRNGGKALIWILCGFTIPMLIFGFLALREANGIQIGLGVLDRNNKAMRRSLEDETDRMIKDEQEGRSKPPLDPYLFKWWEEHKRSR